MLPERGAAAAARKGAPESGNARPLQADLSWNRHRRSLKLRGFGFKGFARV